MMIGSLARVERPMQQGAFLNKEGVVLDCTRSLNAERSLVYFLFFEALGIRAWFDEKQLVEVRVCRSDEDDPAA